MDHYSSGPFFALDVLGGQKLYDKISGPPAYPRHFLDILPEDNPVKVKFLEGNPMITSWGIPPSSTTDSPTAHLEEHLGGFPVIGPTTKPRKQRGTSKSRTSSQQDVPIETRPDPRTPVKPAGHLTSSQQDVTSKTGQPPYVEPVHPPKDPIGKSRAQPSSPPLSDTQARPKGDVPSGTEPASPPLFTGPEQVSGPKQSGTVERPEIPLGSGQGPTGRPVEDTSKSTSSGPMDTDLGRAQGQTDVSTSGTLQVIPAVAQTLPQSIQSLFAEFGAPNVMILAQDLASHQFLQLQQQVSESQSLIQGLVVTSAHQRAQLLAKTISASALSRQNASQANQIVDLQSQIVQLQRQVEEQQQQLAIKDTPAALVDVLNFMKQHKSPPTTPAQSIQALPEVQELQKTVSQLSEKHDSGLQKLSSDLQATIAKSIAEVQAKIDTVAATIVTATSPSVTKGEKRQRSPEEDTSGQKRQRTGKELVLREMSPELSDIEGQEEEQMKMATLASLGLLDIPQSGIGGTSSGYEREELTKETDTGEEMVDRSLITGPIEPLPIRTHNSEDPTLLRQINPTIDSRDKYVAIHTRWVNKFRSTKDLWSESDIKRVDNCKIRSFEKVIQFLECRITRRDDSVHVINDADFPFLHPNDWKDICDIIGGAISSGRSIPKEDRAVFGRMKQLLSDYVHQWSEHDVDTAALHHLALPAALQKSPPPDNLDYPEGTILMEPEPGLVYHRKLNKVTRNFFFRFSEIQKYSMTDLLKFAKILDNWRPVRPAAEYALVKKFFEDLNYQKEVRSNLREMNETIKDHFQKM